MTAKQLRALRLHAKRLDAAAATANRQYEQVRAAWGHYASGDSGMLSIAAHAVDDATAAARSFRAGLDRIEREAAAA